MVALSSFARRFAGPLSVHRRRSRTPCPQARPEMPPSVGGRPQRWCAEVMDMKADKASDSTDLASVSVNEVRLVGRVSRDPEQRVLPSGDEMWTFLLVVPRPPGGRQQAERGRHRLRRVGRSRPGVGRELGRRRRRRGQRTAAQALLPGRQRCGLAGRGGGDGGTDGPPGDYSSRSDRMSTPTLGLGWNDVAFSGSSRPASATRTTRSNSGAGIRTATPRTDRIRASASSTEWW